MAQQQDFFSMQHDKAIICARFALHLATTPCSVIALQHYIIEFVHQTGNYSKCTWIWPHINNNIQENGWLDTGPSLLELLFGASLSKARIHEKLEAVYIYIYIYIYIFIYSE